MSDVFGCGICLHAIVELIAPALNPAVADGGIDCETVVDGATELADEVSMV